MEINLDTAVKQYLKHREVSKAYYDRNRELICKKRMDKYRAENPVVKRRGRPPKVAEDESV